MSRTGALAAVGIAVLLAFALGYVIGAAFAVCRPPLPGLA